MDTVIRALPTILKAQSGVQYVVVGDGGLRDKLASLAIETGVAENVTFAGEISDVELAELYRRCDVFVLPSRGQGPSGLEGGEGFGRVYVEAALAGKPVVGSLCGGAAEAVVHGKTGFLVDPNSAGEVARAVLDILQDRELAGRLGSAGRKWALENFSEEALRGALAELLQPYGFENRGVGEFAHAGGPL